MSCLLVCFFLFFVAVPLSTNTKALYDTFSLFGNILSCKVATDDAGDSKGYGYVHYETGVSANMAITKINGMLIAGKQVGLEAERTYMYIYFVICRGSAGRWRRRAQRWFVGKVWGRGGVTLRVFDEFLVAFLGGRFPPRKRCL